MGTKVKEYCVIYKRCVYCEFCNPRTLQCVLKLAIRDRTEEDIKVMNNGLADVKKRMGK